MVEEADTMKDVALVMQKWIFRVSFDISSVGTNKEPGGHRFSGSLDNS